MILTSLAVLCAWTPLVPQESSALAAQELDRLRVLRYLADAQKAQAEGEPAHAEALGAELEHLARLRYLGDVATTQDAEKQKDKAVKKKLEAERKANKKQVPVQQPGYLGVTLADGDGDGVQIVSVASGSPAEKAGLKAGDRLVEFNGEGASDVAALTSQIQRHNAGSAVELRLERDLTVRFDAHPEDGASRAFLGVTLRNDDGAVIDVVNAGSAAARARLLAGDRLLSIDGQDLASHGELIEHLRGREAESEGRLRISRGLKLRLGARGSLLAAPNQSAEAGETPTPWLHSEGLPKGAYRLRMDTPQSGEHELRWRLEGPDGQKLDPQIRTQPDGRMQLFSPDGQSFWSWKVAPEGHTPAPPPAGAGRSSELNAALSELRHELEALREEMANLRSEIRDMRALRGGR